MSNRTIKHEIKLQPSVIILLGFLAFGVCANAFAPAFAVKDAVATEGVAVLRQVSNQLAELSYGDKIKVELTGHISNDLTGSVRNTLSGSISTCEMC